MIYIALIAIAGLLLLNAVGAIPNDSVGASLVIAPALLAGAMAVGVHEAWTTRRGALGWIINLAVSLFSVFVSAPFGGMVLAIALLLLLNEGPSLAAAGEPAMSLALAGDMLIVLLGAWAALQIVNRWR